MKKLKLWSGILLIFILGCLAGSFTTQWFVHERIASFHKNPPARFLMHHLARQLDLSEKQKQAIRIIVNRSCTQLHAQRDTLKPQFDQIMDETFAEIARELNPDQQQKLKEFRQNMQRRSRHRGHLPPSPPHDHHRPWLEE